MTKRVRKQCVLATIGLFAFACVGFISGDIPLNEIVSQSSMIVYARADTNNAPNIHLVITEIGRISMTFCHRELSLEPRFRFNGLPMAGFCRMVPFSSMSRASSFRWIAPLFRVYGSSRQVGGMTIKEFRITFGL